MTLDAAHVLARIRAVAAPAAVVELYGSCVYAPAYASDVDVLVSNDDSQRLAIALEMEEIPTTPPRVHGMLDGIDVDITIVNGDSDLAMRMRSGPRDAAALVTQLREHDCYEAFQAAWPHVRRFVQLRALGTNGLGWFGSFGWALLVAVPLVTELRDVAAGTAFPAWLRWLARHSVGARIGFSETLAGESDPFFLTAPSPPLRDVARLSKRAAAVLFAEARAAAQAIGNAVTDEEAITRIADIADDRPAGTTLVIRGSDERGRGRYDGVARGLIRELEALGAVRSWGRFDLVSDDWHHRITVPAHRAKSARELVENWLALHNIDASVD